MYLVIMPTEKASNFTEQKHLLELVPKVLKNPDDYPDVKVWTITNDNTMWHEFTSTYSVPDEQYLTRFFFVAGATASNNSSIGNCLDNVWFSKELPPPSPGYGRLQITKTVKGLTSDEMKNYEVTVDIEGETENTIKLNNFGGPQEDGSYSKTEEMELKAGTKSVSYTHLDVYKRQVYP